MRVKKVRGLKRKRYQMIAALEEATDSFPTDFYINYWNCYLPVARDFIQSMKTPMAIKRSCLQTLIDQVEHLINNKPADGEHYRVMAMIQLPNLWYSQIIIFKGDEYFTGFFDRDTDYQKWTPTSSENLACWKLNIPSSFKQQGYVEEIFEATGTETREIFFLGELD